MSAMTRDEVLKLAMDADAFIEYTGDDVIDALTFTPDQLESFARAVAAREEERAGYFGALFNIAAKALDHIASWNEGPEVTAHPQSGRGAGSERH